VEGPVLGVGPVALPGRSGNKTSKFHPILMFKWTLGMHVSRLPV
jgi:hypothetical protein